ncbi:UNVERIFIED_CONTAM: Protein-tyrosine sulfotransferase [Sesamum latifolium]|uniref:Protein-tyrosine sulfotransferase n=1 Tax=Sesamum latifolium TaxID=2727402 RepID=A0AAW2Y4U5_9LAMI
MGVSQSDGGRMEGWLYLIRSNRIGLQYSRKRYFVLQDHLLKSFKSVPLSPDEDPVRSAIIDACIRVTDNGRESIHRKPNQNQGDFEFATREPQSLRLNCSSKHSHSVDWTAYSSSVSDAMTSDVVAPSPWKIFGCRNGLRLFKEAKDKEHHGKWDDHPAIMAVGVVDGTSEAIFQTLMSLGPSRSEGMKRRDLLLRRYWRREDDGTYVILYHSVFHQKCPPKRGYVRACLKSGGYVISPVNQGKRSVVRHMLAIDWKFWRSYLQTSSARSITISMLGRLAALRELFKAKVDCSSSDFSSGEIMSNNSIQQSKKELKVEVQTRVENGQNWEDVEEETVKTPSERSSLVGLHDASDEFFDVSEPLDYDQSENGWPSDFGSEVYSQDARQPKLSTAAVFVKRLHELADVDAAVQKKGYVDLHEMAREDSLSCKYGCTLPKDPTCNLLCSWTETDPSTFLIRGKTYLDDRKKIKAKGTLMEMVGADWLRSDKREDDLGGRPGGIVQKYAAKGGPEFFFIVNIQVPGSTTYNLALYYMMSTPIEDAPLLESFVKGDDAYRNSRFKLIPYISKGSWIVKQSVGKKACLVGQALEINYFHGKNYLELGIDIGSSTVARGVVSLVLGYLNNLVIEMAFLVQALARNYMQCEYAVKKWASSSLGSEVKDDKHALRDLLFFLHIPRTGGRSYFYCFLKKLYSKSQECPRSYDKLRLNPRKPHCRLLSTHDDYSVISKLPEEKTSVVTILRDPIDRVFSTYEFSVEVAARFLIHPNLTSVARMAQHKRRNASVVSTLDVWPWKYLVPWMIEDLFARRDARKLRGQSHLEANNPYDMEDILMPLHEYINDSIARDIIHNGATFQIAGLTNYSYFSESHEVRHCVLRYQILGGYVLEVAKKRLDNMLYVGLTENHRGSATMFANVVGEQVISKHTTSSSSTDVGTDDLEKSSLHTVMRSDANYQGKNTYQMLKKVSSINKDEASRENSTAGKLMEAYESCISTLRKAQAQRRINSLKQISPANFTKDARHQVPEAIIQEIASLNSLDMELYAYAKNIFKKQEEHAMQSVGYADRLSSTLPNSTYSNSYSPHSWKFLSLAATGLFFASLHLCLPKRKKKKTIKN